MQYLRIECEGETRWVNLNHIVRATLAAKAGDGGQVLAIFFSNSSHECDLKIDSRGKGNAAAIKSLIGALDAATHIQ